MPLLKQGTASVQPQAFSLRDIERQAASLLARAQQQASALLEEARREAEVLRHSARAEGFAAGQAEGRKSGQEQGTLLGRQQALSEHAQRLDLLVQSLESVAMQIEQSRHTLLHHAAEDVVRLAVAIARRAIARFAALHPDATVANVNEALRFVVGRNDVRVAIHPSLERLLNESLPQLQARWANLRHVKIVADPDIAPGGARVYFQHGEIDASLDGMIDRIAEELIGAGGAV